jgi:hypothetical protein
VECFGHAEQERRGVEQFAFWLNFDTGTEKLSCYEMLNTALVRLRQGRGGGFDLT